MTRKIRVVTAVLIAASASVAAAFATSLGGLQSDRLGADVNVVSSCDTDGVSVWYDGAYSPAEGSAVLRTLHIGDISEDCAGQVMKVVIGNFEEETVAEGETIVDTEAVTWPILLVPVSGEIPAQQIYNIAITITDEVAP